MSIAELTREMQRWAYYRDMRYRPYPRASNDDAAADTDPGDHPLSRARQFAPMTRENAAKLLRGRDGRSRRTAVGQAIGMEIVPTWSSDPVPCKETRIAGPLPMATIDHGMPSEVEWIERGMAALKRKAPVQEIVVRVEFTVNASQLVKARIAAEEYGGRLSKWQYRRQLALGLSFMEGLRQGA